MPRKRYTSYGPKEVVILSMNLEEWRFASCIAHFATGDDWATLYDIESNRPSLGHATKLLAKAKSYYEQLGKLVGGSIALNDHMSNLYKKLGIPEYRSEEDFDRVYAEWEATLQPA